MEGGGGVAFLVVRGCGAALSSYRARRKQPMTFGRPSTEDVFNQSPPFCDINLIGCDVPLMETVASDEALRAQIMPVLGTNVYDPAFTPWWGKRGMTIGMGMTERQGGTDVRANITRAEKDGDAYRITGHKWFMSAPMSDGFLVLAQAEGGLTCFVMPRFRPDGTVNALRFQRLN